MELEKLDMEKKKTWKALKSEKNIIGLTEIIAVDKMTQKDI